MDPDEHATRLARETADDPTGWFERLYAGSLEPGGTQAPWDSGEPHPALVAWAADGAVRGAGRRALVVGAGTGDDAAFIASLGFDTLAFDVAPSALAVIRERYPDAPIALEVADLLQLPEPWRGAFDLVFECMTVQSMPVAYHAPATAGVTSAVAPGGTLLVVATGRADDAPEPAGPPWPLTRPEVDAFAGDGTLTPERVERVESAAAAAGYFRWIAEFRRRASSSGR